MAEIANKVVAGLMAPFDVIGMEIFAGCSLGVAMFPADGDDFDSLLKKADIAMYRAKESGRNAFRFWDTEMNASVVEHVELLSAMRAALAQREFTLSLPAAVRPAHRPPDRRGGADPLAPRRARARSRRPASSRWPSARA